MTRYNVLIISISILFGLVNISIARMSAQEDTSSYPFATRDTLATIKVTSKLFWYNIDGHQQVAGDSSQKMIFYHSDEKALIYTDISDLFSENTLWYAYNFGENGRPAYISAINRYPHQTPFYYNTISMLSLIHI